MSPFALELNIRLVAIIDDVDRCLSGFASGLLNDPSGTLSIPSSLNTMCDETARGAVAKSLRNAAQPYWGPKDAIEFLESLESINEVAKPANLYAGYARWIRALRREVRNMEEAAKAT